MVKRRGIRTDPYGTTVLRCHNLLRLLLLVGRVKLQLPTSSMIMQTMCLSGSNHSNLQVQPRIPYSVVGCCEIDKHSSGLLSKRAILDGLHQ